MSISKESMAISRFEIWLFAAVTLACLERPANLGTTTAANVARITRTNNISTRVNPLWRVAEFRLVLDISSFILFINYFI